MLSTQIDLRWHEAGEVPATMQAAVLREFGGPEVLRIEELPTPEPGSGEVLVRVAAVSIGRLLDVLARSGRSLVPLQLPHVLGAEHAGTIVALGEGVTGWSVGQRVATFPVVFPLDDEYRRAGRPELSPGVQMIGTHRAGAYAQYVAVPAENITAVPDIAPDQASALALSAAVAMNQFARIGGVGAGNRVLVPGATSALSSTTALLAKFLGADVVVTSRDEQKRERLRTLGFDRVLDASQPDFADAVRDAFGGRLADVVVDNLGLDDVWRREFDALDAGGTIVTSGAFLGTELPIDIKRLYLRSQRIVGVRTGNLESVRAAWEAVAAGFRTVVDSAFPLAEAPEAHRYVEAGGNVGRVVLAVP